MGNWTRDDIGGPEPVLPKGHPWIAWLMILLLIVVPPMIEEKIDENRQREWEELGGTAIGQIEGKLLTGMNEIGKEVGGDAQQEFQKQIESELNKSGGTVAQRLQKVILRGEIFQPRNGRNALRDLKDEIESADHKLTADETRLLEVVSKSYEAILDKQDPGKELAEVDKELLQKKLGWCGRLLLAAEGVVPPDSREKVLGPAMLFAVVVLGGMLLVVLGILAGLILEFSLFLLFGLRLWPFGLPAVSEAGKGGASGVYVEAFALWMGTFQLGSIFIAQLSLGRMLMPALGMNMLGALVVGMLWPLLRGIPWEMVQRDIGWHQGRGLIVEAWCGVMGYVATLPLLGVGVVGMLVLTIVLGELFPVEGVLDPFAPQVGPSHPILQWVAGGDRGVLLQAAVLACLIAPFVEETMFRGFLLRSLRDSSRWTGGAISFLFSLLFNSFVFAAIHPQGLLGIPPLMAIACGLTLTREWRGSLVASIVAHGLNNSAVMTVLYYAVG